MTRKQNIESYLRLNVLSYSVLPKEVFALWKLAEDIVIRCRPVHSAAMKNVKFSLSWLLSSELWRRDIW
jgi:hypothetical protein